MNVQIQIGKPLNSKRIDMDGIVKEYGYEHGWYRAYVHTVGDGSIEDAIVLLLRELIAVGDGRNQ